MKKLNLTKLKEENKKLREELNILTNTKLINKLSSALEDLKKGKYTTVN